MPRILKKEEIKQPKGGLVIEEHEVGAHPILEESLGAASGVFDMGAYLTQKLGESMPLLCPDGDGSKFVTDKRLQRNSFFDAFVCDPSSHINIIEMYLNALGVADFPLQSRRKLALDAGVKPNVGTSDYAVEQAILKYGLVPESVCPSMSDTMDATTFFAKLNVDLSGYEDLIKDYDVVFYPLPTRDGISVPLSYLAGALPYCVGVAVSVDGRYGFNSEGKVIRTQQSDSHKVVVCRAAGDIPSNLILDSENPNGFIEFAQDYDFHYPKFVFLKKKIMFRLAKINDPSQHSVFLLCENSMTRLGIADSPEVDLTGGDMLKTFSGNYGNAGIQPISEEEMSKYNYLYDIKATKKLNS